MNDTLDRQAGQEPRQDTWPFLFLDAMQWFYGSGSAAKVGPVATAVWCKLLLHADAADWIAYPSLDSIASTLGRKQRTIIDAIDRLVAAGMVKRVSSGTAGRATRYRLVIPDRRKLQSQSTTETAENCTPDRRKLQSETAENCSSRPQKTAHEPNHRTEPCNRTKNRRRAATAADPFAGVDVPLALQGDTFKQTWLDWIAHRAEIRKPLTPTAIKAQLRGLADVGEAGAVAALHASIRNGWTGVFPGKDSVNGQQRTRHNPDANRGTYNDPRENPLLAG